MFPFVQSDTNLSGCWAGGKLMGERKRKRSEMDPREIANSHSIPATFSGVVFIHMKRDHATGKAPWELRRALGWLLGWVACHQAISTILENRKLSIKIEAKEKSGATDKKLPCPHTNESRQLTTASTSHCLALYLYSFRSIREVFQNTSPID